MWQIAHPYITITHTIRRINANCTYILHEGWMKINTSLSWFQIGTKHWKYTSLLCNFSFAIPLYVTPLCPCHFIPSKSISEFTSLSDAPHNYSSPLGDPRTEQERLLTYPSHPSQAREEWAPSWLPAMVSPLPLSCSLQLEIVYVDIMRIELLIKKKLRSKITFYPPIWAR